MWMEDNPRLLHGRSDERRSRRLGQLKPFGEIGRRRSLGTLSSEACLCPYRAVRKLFGTTRLGRIALCWAALPKLEEWPLPE